jgi:hypothetical protein
MALVTADGTESKPLIDLITIDKIIGMVRPQ